MQLVIREANSEDATLLTALHAAVHNHHARALPQLFKATDGKDPAIIQDFVTHLADENSRLYIAEAEGEAVGYMLLQIRHIEENAYAYAHSRLHIDQMPVNESHRGKGVGHALMQKAMTLAQEWNLEYLSLGVWTFNEEAIAFYKREGFEAVSLNMRQKL